MKSGTMRALRRHLIAGIVVVAPITITAIVLWWIFQRLDGLLGRFLYPAIGIDVPGLGLLLLLGILIVTGWTAQRALGARAVAAWNFLLERFPLTRRIYGASNRIVQTVLGQHKRFLEDVVLFEYPSDGRWSVGFLTAKGDDVAWTGIENGVAVFVPTSPNPTTGWMVIVPRDRVRRLPVSLEEGLTFVLSAGTVAPARDMRDHTAAAADGSATSKHQSGPAAFGSDTPAAESGPAADGSDTPAAESGSAADRSDTPAAESGSAADDPGTAARAAR